MSEQRFDFLRELVKNIPDISVAEEAANYNEDEPQSSPEENYPDSDTPYDLSMPSTSTRASRISTNGDQTNQRQLASAHSYIENGSSTFTGGIQVAHGQLRTQLDEASRAHLKRESDIMQRLRQRITASATSTTHDLTAMPSSVIMHTTSLLAADPKSNDCLPPKLYRTDSAPATAAGNWQQQNQYQKPQHNHPPMAHSKIPTIAHHQHQHQHQQQQQQPPPQRQRLKHQSQSVPSAEYHGQGHSSSNNNSCSSSLPYNSSTHAARQQQQQQPPPIPAPIVSIDFCNKPFVKIDYSNLAIPATTRTSAIAPLSAPANITASAATAFNFNADPVINIDLSNIVGTSASSLNNQPAVATISIGNISAPVSSISNPLVAAPTKSANKTTTVNELLNTKAAAAASVLEVPAAKIHPAKKPNSFFELDEDYDNI